MCATSGDTGPATLEAFADDENIKAVCLYPQGGTSEIQRQQMVKQSAANLKILGVRGNFDDTQRALKSLLADEGFQKRTRARKFKSKRRKLGKFRQDFISDHLLPLC